MLTDVGEATSRRVVMSSAPPLLSTTSSKWQFLLALQSLRCAPSHYVLPPRSRSGLRWEDREARSSTCRFATVHLTASSPVNVCSDPYISPVKGRSRAESTIIHHTTVACFGDQFIITCDWRTDKLRHRLTMAIAYAQVTFRPKATPRPLIRLFLRFVACRDSSEYFAIRH